ncbi:MAG: caspase family protein [Thermotogaceae bacterium]|nr:caspase family protein [Thermotogaceae bacterium]
MIFYYAGHGISKDGKFYFIPADADPEDSYTWIPFERLERYIERNRKIVWLIDACYSGAMVKGRPLRAVRIQKEALHAQGDQVIITSSSGNEISREMPDGSGGLFTVSLVKAIQGGADKDKDG